MVSWLRNKATRLGRAGQLLGVGVQRIQRLGHAHVPDGSHDAGQSQGEALARALVRGNMAGQASRHTWRDPTHDAPVCWTRGP